MKNSSLLLRALLIWTAFGLFETLQAWAMQPSRGLAERSLWLAFVRNMPWWWAWAAITPVILGAVRRFPITRARLLPHLVVHAVVGALVTAGHLLLAARVLFANSGNPRLASWIDLARNFADGYLAVEFMTYWAVVALFHAFITQRALTDTTIEQARLAARTAQLERDVSDARLDALRMELNPHFLFNTLNSVSGLVRNGQREGAIEMLAQLGDLLRFTLGAAHTPTSTLRDEVDFLSRYLAIEGVRFRDRLQVRYDIATEVESVEVPTLILQPLVENAVRHGIARAPGGGEIVVAARRTGADICLEVTNTSQQGAAVVPGTDGIGLTNTRKRLSALYGSAAGLIATPLPQGFRATITLPFREVSHAT